MYVNLFPEGNYHFQLDTILTHVNQQDLQIPEYFSLSAYPNPFNPSTNLRVSINTPGTYSIRIYQIDGRVITSTGNEFINIGTYEFRLQNLGASGIKIAILQGVTEGGRLVKKTFKLVQLDGSSGSPSITKIQSGSESLGLTKSAKVSESENRFKLSFKYYGDKLPGYRDTSIILTYTTTQIFDYIPVSLE